MINTRLDFIKVTGLAVAGLLSGIDLKGALIKSQMGLPDLLLKKDGQHVNYISEWNEIRKTIIQSWKNYLGIIVPNPDPPVMRILQDETEDDIIRQYVEYESEPGINVRAYIIKPQSSKKQLPGVVALHSTSDNKMLYISGAEKGEITPLGFNLAKHGFIVICPQCFLWHDKGHRSYEQQVERFQSKHTGSKGMAKMLFDASRAVDVLASMPDVDNRRIGAIGHSLGGKEAFYLGAFDERVKVIVSNEGGIGIDFSNWDDPWYLGKEIHSFGHEHHELLAICAPKPFLLIGGDSSDGIKSTPYINAVKPVYRLYGREQNIKLYNHGQGHNITPEAEKITYNWMIDHL